MAKNQNKTRETDASVMAFINSVEKEQTKQDCLELVDMMQELVGAGPKMWGPSIVGFGEYHYKYDSGREGDFFKAGFSPRKTNLTLYIMAGFESNPELMEKLGKYKTGKSCLYVKKLDDIDRDVLKKLIVESVKFIEEKYPKS